MLKPCISVFWFALLLQVLTYCGASNIVCRNSPNPVSRVSLKINTRRNQSGDWETTFSALKNLENSSNNISVDVMHEVIECEGKQVLHIGGLIKDTAKANEKLLFHTRCGTNVAIINEGLTVKKLNKNEPFNASAFTNRALKDDELFEVRLDEKINTKGASWGIGVTVHDPRTVIMQQEMYFVEKTWIMHHNNVYEKKRQIFSGFSKNLNSLQIGDRIGVMRSKFGALHFYVNGVDLGPAVSNLPSPVYGVFELWNDGTMATIVHS